MNTEGIAGLLTAQGIDVSRIDVSRIMEGRGGAPDWLPEDAALACAGLPMRCEYAFRFRFALDDSCLSGLTGCLLSEAARLHVEKRWPDRVDDRRWLPDLARTAILTEWLATRRPSAYKVLLDVDGMHQLGQFTPEAWSKTVGPAWAMLGHKLDVWCSIATGHIYRRTRDDEENAA